MCHVDLVQPRCLQSQLQGVGDILGFHRGAELPGNDVAREVVKNRRQVEPTPTGHLQVSEVGLPKLVRRRRLVLELVGGLHHDEGRPSSIEKIVDVDLPRPRSRETLRDSRFAELRELVWSILMQEARDAEFRREGDI